MINILLKIIKKLVIGDVTISDEQKERALGAIAILLEATAKGAVEGAKQ